MRYSSLAASCFILAAQAAPLNAPNGFSYSPTLTFPYSYSNLLSGLSPLPFPPNRQTTYPLTTYPLATLASSTEDDNPIMATVPLSEDTPSIFQLSMTSPDIFNTGCSHDTPYACISVHDKGCNDPQTCQSCPDDSDLECQQAEILPDGRICPIKSIDRFSRYQCKSFNRYVPEDCSGNDESCKLCPPGADSLESCRPAVAKLIEIDGIRTRFICPQHDDKVICVNGGPG